MSRIATLILAAGQGTRMKSRLPKVLHPLCGAPLIAYPLQLAAQMKSETTVLVVGHGRDAVQRAVAQCPGGDRVRFAVQTEQRGTGHAVMCALPALKEHDGWMLILSGDVPLLTHRTLQRLQRQMQGSTAPLGFVTFVPGNSAGYGRVVRENDEVRAIVEHRDCTPKQRAIKEANAGTYLIEAAFLRSALKKLRQDNAQNEFFLTDLVAMAAQRGAVPTVQADEAEVHGINDRVDLAQVERVLLSQKAQTLMRNGVTLHDPDTICIHPAVSVGPDTDIGRGVHITGQSRIGAGCHIEPGVLLHDTVVADGARVRAYSVIEGSHIGAGAQVGPMARLRPGSRLGDNAHVGNWVELKNTVMGDNSKASHLAYLGDGDIGDNANIGAGVIFCNYDGYLKHRTTIEEDVFVGSDCQLIAPVTLHRGAYIASGATVTHDVPEDAMAIARARQVNRADMGRLFRERQAAEKALRAAANESPKARRKSTARPKPPAKGKPR